MKYVVFCRNTNSYLCECGSAGRAWSKDVLQNALKLDLRTAELFVKEEDKRGDLITNAKTMEIIPVSVVEVMEM